MYKLAVDVMGYENDINESIKACRQFCSEHNDLKIILFGNKNLILPHLESNNEFEIIHTEQFISQDDQILNIRRKPHSSMQLAANFLNENKVDGLLSAGSTPIFVFIMYQTIGLIDGINKPGFMPTIPTVDNSCFQLLDVGASIDVNEFDLARFAIIGNIYSKQKNKNPKIGLLNIGTEEHKGTELVRKTNELLKKYKKINYVGFVESNKLLNHVADVVVTDGFSGNIVLKACEGSVKTIANLIKNEIKKPKNIFSLLFSVNFLRKTFNKFDYKNYAGAFVMGLNKICVKTHGSADYKQFYSSLRMLYECVKNNILDDIKKEIIEFNIFLNKEKQNDR